MRVVRFILYSAFASVVFFFFLFSRNVTTTKQFLLSRSLVSLASSLFLLPFLCSFSLVLLPWRDGAVGIVDAGGGVLIIHFFFFFFFCRTARPDGGISRD
ncbi:hypothetical protein F4778DRAFT_723863 [Xylariomycetidae sp. FL2044]|nr:hypothetical protein F4778DRAFT_723863 [Xylariomycetidae sp. FL2044]